jgi:hypothetical protein
MAAVDVSDIVEARRSACCKEAPVDGAERRRALTKSSVPLKQPK